MDKLYFIKTSKRRLLATLDKSKNVRYLNESENTNFPQTDSEEEIREYLINKIDIKDTVNWSEGMVFDNLGGILSLCEYSVMVEKDPDFFYAALQTYWIKEVKHESIIFNYNIYKDRLKNQGEKETFKIITKEEVIKLVGVEEIENCEKYAYYALPQYIKK